MCLKEINKEPILKIKRKNITLEEIKNFFHKNYTGENYDPSEWVVIEDEYMLQWEITGIGQKAIKLEQLNPIDGEWTCRYVHFKGLAKKIKHGLELNKLEKAIKNSFIEVI